MLDPDYGFTAEYRRVHPKPAQLAPELAEEIARLEQRLAELDDISEDDWTDELAAEAEQLEERHAELARTAGDQAVYSDQDRARRRALSSQSAITAISGCRASRSLASAACSAAAWPGRSAFAPDPFSVWTVC
jgi:hypothetical protein